MSGSWNNFWGRADVIDPFQMRVKEIFQFKDGRTLFVGPIEGGPDFIPPQRCLLEIGPDLASILDMEGEVISNRSMGPTGTTLRALSTRATRCVDREAIGSGDWRLSSIRDRVERDPFANQSTRSLAVHRHLLGIDSPPPQYVPDPMTQGPVLPEGWDGDAWCEPSGSACYLRAWNKQSGRIAVGQGKTYAEARELLLKDVANGRRRVVVSAQEAG